jgi:hypothetical protein
VVVRRGWTPGNADGRFIPKLRAAYNERVVTKVAARLRGTIHRAIEGGVVKIKVRF